MNLPRRALCLAGLASPWAVLHTPAQARAAPLNAAGLSAIHSALAAAVAQGRMPGAVVHVERAGVSRTLVVGHKAWLPTFEALTPSTVYDAASLTKVVATTPVVLQLVDAGVLALETPVKALIPAFSSGDDVTVRQLLTHTSGLPAGLPLSPDWAGNESAIDLACNRVATNPPGTFFRYSDVNFILLGEIASRVAGKPLDQLAQDGVFAPLGMNDTGFLPLQHHSAARIAPTEIVNQQPLRGQVHDPTARRMGGVAGHAGMFTTVADLARYVRMLLAGGVHEGRVLLKRASLQGMTQLATPPNMPEKRGLGMDIQSPFSRARGKLFGADSFGHTGFTGCALWVDPASGGFYVMLSNRVHPHGGHSVADVYEQVATAAAQAVGLR